MLTSGGRKRPKQLNSAIDHQLKTLHNVYRDRLHFPRCTEPLYSISSNCTMSNDSGFSLQSLFDAALESYEKQTGTKLIDHPLARQLENCHSIDAIMDVLQQQARTFTEFRGDDGKFKKSLKRTVHVLHALSASTTLGEGVGLVCRRLFLYILRSLNSLYSHSHLQRQSSPASPF
jgi:hypothetical protein